jgi:2-C-methyl-D-erythritol 2,4-cyclodiphosphate synthase
MIHSEGFNIENVDATIVAEEPKLAAYIDEMRHNIGDALNIATEQVSVKSTTSAALGFLGRGEGIAAHAVALIERR